MTAPQTPPPATRANLLLILQVALLAAQIGLAGLFLSSQGEAPAATPPVALQQVVEEQVRLALEQYRAELALLAPPASATESGDAAEPAEEPATPLPLPTQGPDVASLLQEEIARLRNEIKRADSPAQRNTAPQESAASLRVLENLERLSGEINKAPAKQLTQNLASIERMVMETKLGVDNLRREVRQLAGAPPEPKTLPGRAVSVPATATPVEEATDGRRKRPSSDFIEEEDVPRKPTAGAPGQVTSPASAEKKDSPTPKAEQPASGYRTPTPTLTPEPTATPEPTSTPLPSTMVPKAGLPPRPKTPTPGG